MLRKKLLVYRPFTFSPPGNAPEKKYDEVPAVFHVLRSDKNWIWLGDEEGEPIGQVVRSSIDAVSTEWNTKHVVQTKIGTLFFKSAEDAALKQNPVQMPRDYQDSILPLLSIEKGKNPYYKLGRPLNRRFNGNVTFPLWSSMIDEKGDEQLSEGLMLSDNDIKAAATRIDQVTLQLQAKIEPSQRGDILKHLSSLQALFWKVTSGEEDRDPAHIRKVEFALPRSAIQKTNPGALKQKNGEDFLKQIKEWSVGGERLRSYLNDLKAPACDMKIGSSEKATYKFVPFSQLP